MTATHCGGQFDQILQSYQARASDQLQQVYYYIADGASGSAVDGDSFFCIAIDRQCQNFCIDVDDFLASMEMSVADLCSMAGLS